MTRLEQARAQVEDDAWLPLPIGPTRLVLKLLVDLAEAFDRYEATRQGPEYMACREALEKLREPA